MLCCGLFRNDEINCRFYESGEQANRIELLALDVESTLGLMNGVAVQLLHVGVQDSRAEKECR